MKDAPAGTSLAAQVEAAQRAIANWPADVKRAMGLEPTPSAEVIELRSKLDRAEADVRNLQKIEASLLERADRAERRLSSIRVELEKEARGEQSGEYTLTRLVLLTKPSDVERQRPKTTG